MWSASSPASRWTKPPSETGTKETAAMTLAGHTALVTGGSKGIGRGIALELARQGARVAINYRRDGPEVQETMAALAEMGRPALSVAADVRRADQVSAATPVRPRYRDRC